MTRVGGPGVFALNGDLDSLGGHTVKEFKPSTKNTLRGLLSLELPNGLIVHGITLHEKNDSRWVSMPVRKCLRDSQKTWAPIIEFASKESRDKFQSAALAAIDRHLNESGGAQTPAPEGRW